MYGQAGLASQTIVRPLLLHLLHVMYRMVSSSMHVSNMSYSGSVEESIILSIKTSSSESRDQGESSMHACH